MKRRDPKNRLKRKNYSNIEIEDLAKLAVQWNARMEIFDENRKRVMTVEPQNRIR